MQHVQIGHSQAATAQKAQQGSVGGGETGHAADNIHKEDTKSERHAPQTSPGNQQPDPEVQKDAD